MAEQTIVGMSTIMYAASFPPTVAYMAPFPDPSSIPPYVPMPVPVPVPQTQPITVELSPVIIDHGYTLADIKQKLEEVLAELKKLNKKPRRRKAKRTNR